MVDHFYRPALKVDSLLEDPMLDAFIRNYKNLRFGWESAQKLAWHALPCPGILSGEDDWIYRAYLYNIDPQRYADNDIQSAIMLLHPKMRGTRRAIDAMLIIRDIDVRRIAMQMGFRASVIAAYEKLFFNVLDRKNDADYIRDIVYPETRLVEWFDKYASSEDLGRIMMRAGYNNGLDYVLYVAGFNSNLLQNLTMNDLPGNMESLIMANGFVMAKSGWLNQYTNAVGVRSATNLIAAAKQNGDTAQVDPITNGHTLGNALFAELNKLKDTQYRNQREYAKKMEAAFVTVEVAKA